ncbi:MAG: hypothetical protein WC052_04385 [Patescibacteria group bacterium]
MDHPSLTQYLGSVNQDPDILATIANEDWTLDMALAVAGHNPTALPPRIRLTIMTYVPIRFHTRDVWKKAVCSVYNLYALMPKEFRDERFHGEVTRIWPILYGRIPLHCRTSQLSLDTFINKIVDPDFLMLVPPESQSDELILRALTVSVHNIKYVTYPTIQQQIVVLEQDPKMIAHIEPQTEELCKYAMNIAINRPQYSPKIICDVLSAIRHQSDEICLLALQHWPRAMEFIRDQREELCLAAIAQFKKFRNDGERSMNMVVSSMLKLIRNQTLNICMAAYNKYKSSFICIRDRTMRNRIVRLVLSRAIIALREVHLSTLLLTEVCEAARPALFPVPAYCERNVLTPPQLWQLAKLVREWSIEAP